MRSIIIAIVLAWTISSGHAQSATQRPPNGTKAFMPPSTPWGDPDLEGTYTDKDEMGIPMERPTEFEGKRPEDISAAELATIVKARQVQAKAFAAVIGGGAGNDTGAGPPHWYEHLDSNNSRAWMIVDPADGRIPPLAPGAREAPLFGEERADSYEDRSLYDRCITRGVTGSMLPVIYGNSFQFLQGPGFVAIREEMIHETRIIPLNRRPHMGARIRSYMGDARGYFDHGTLVVETTNFTNRTAIGINGNGRPDSEKLRLTERFTPIGPRTLEWSVTVDDPGTWLRPWTFTLNLTKDPTQGVFEYACHEGNLGLSNILSVARTEEQRHRR
jgi:hypothetical protein